MYKSGCAGYIRNGKLKYHSYQSQPRYFVRGTISHTGHHASISLEEWHEVIPNKASTLTEDID